MVGTKITVLGQTPRAKAPQTYTPTKTPGQKPPKTKNPWTKTPRVKFCLSFLKNVHGFSSDSAMVTSITSGRLLVVFKKNPFGLA